MFQLRSVLLGTLAFSVPITVQSDEWFDKNTPLTQAHQHLLNNDLQAMFDSLVEVWQLEQNRNIKSHLNDLLIQSLTTDCGKGLDKRPLPEWLKSITINRQDIQSPGRDAYRVAVDVTSINTLDSVELTEWVDKPISNVNSVDSYNNGKDRKELRYVKRYDLNSKLSMGLYRLDITASDQQSWSAWVIIGEPKARQVVRWASKDEWQIEKKALLNPYCPLPELNVSLYDYVDGQYSKLWSKSYVSEYPNSLEVTNLSSDRYVLAVTMTSQRWQGPITIEQSQVISKTYDVSVDE
ncbi:MULTISPECIES: DUF2861 family protein [Vibrio]|uniref:DUF2861 family protein n=1 Tax=Vibrio aestuarianus TaxID=28171 RepID=A0A9X4FIP1_9VIBR|nr:MULTISPECIES: DUF2861 family protein [Vibrio]MDE1214229.1 DUF2861 family protein [Vibrio aestuarianus]MDE1219404.1 DUF2861 family protein [Vibrio aestuarianus]MDE1229301.1 DUF2861 family protein [Vibrio aestuarianus]MDE1229908.1 DUF2861 family protein [Vibrio aestuarianus]MDE1235055.1 DUF2861 family protein [Vibrio aestuarianus]